MAKKSQIPEGGVISVETEGKSLALVKLEGAVYALVDTCPHDAGPLSDGQIVGEDIECPWHRPCFNVKTDRVTRDPATEDRSIIPPIGCLIQTPPPARSACPIPRWVRESI